MADSPYVYVPHLRLSLEIADAKIAEEISTWCKLAEIAPWNAIRCLAQRELLCDPADPRTREQAEQFLLQHFGDSPMTNTGLDPADSHAAGVAELAYVRADIFLDPLMRPMLPGTESAIVGQGVGSDWLVRATPWPHRAGSDDELREADIILDSLVSALGLTQAD
jgi:hypothetical protein